ncbi:hypothetical protein GY45DRAFT_323999 [Cubamyces sp. BRFM 1775]|nr:hypothetical protein GY45DRAFT_323999 [Cubamyces sp. BRFM 1775]
MVRPSDRRGSSRRHRYAEARRQCHPDGGGPSCAPVSRRTDGSKSDCSWATAARHWHIGIKPRRASPRGRALASVKFDGGTNPRPAVGTKSTAAGNIHAIPSVQALQNICATRSNAAQPNRRRRPADLRTVPRRLAFLLRLGESQSSCTRQLQASERPRNSRVVCSLRAVTCTGACGPTVHPSRTSRKAQEPCAELVSCHRQIRPTLQFFKQIS